MTNPDYTHYVLIIDRSGSMSRIREDAQEGVRSFVKEQEVLPGKATLSLYQFDDKHERVLDFTDLKGASSYVLKPRGWTRLLDAIGSAVTEMGEALAALPEDERPGKVLVLIVTDGKENDSREYELSQVRNLITQQRETYGWEFSYVGANVDAFTEASNLNIPLASAANFEATPAGTRGVFDKMSNASTAYRLGSSSNISYN